MTGFFDHFGGQLIPLYLNFFTAMVSDIPLIVQFFPSISLNVFPLDTGYPPSENYHPILYFPASTDKTF